MNKVTPEQRRRVFSQLMHNFDMAASADIAFRWTYLEAAHVLGQQDFALHWASHTTMLRFALQTRDLGEAAGQIFRLALVPLGHLLQRLPAGNPGRAHVSALATMPADERLSHMISLTVADTQTHSFLNFHHSAVSFTYAPSPVHRHDLPSAPTRLGGRRDGNQHGCGPAAKAACCYRNSSCSRS